VRRIGISLALIMRLVLLSTIAFIVGLTAPVFDLGLHGPLNAHGEPELRDRLLVARPDPDRRRPVPDLEGHQGDPPHVDPTRREATTSLDKTAAISNVGAAIFQIILLDLVFSIDSILTAVGMTDHLPIMIIAVIIAVTVMLLAADPLANFINNNPTVVMLALGFLLMIGAVLIADGFGVHVPKGYIYAAMAFSAVVEGLNMMSRKSRARRRRATAATKRSRRDRSFAMNDVRLCTARSRA
jgi:predicted tellurium resistance membrane protein TerC